MAAYIALLRKDPDSDYGVEFPDFPGCVTAGSTLEEAAAMAREALAFHVEGMIADGEDLPAPSSPYDLKRDGRSIAFLVELPEPADRTMRVNITLPASTLAKIDAFAEQEGYTRSGLITRAAERMISAGAAPEPKVKAKKKAKSGHGKSARRPGGRGRAKSAHAA